MAFAEDPSLEHPLPITCPHCAVSLEVDATGRARTYQCPQCAQPFTLDPTPSEATPADAPPPRPELDGRRIANLTRLRRAAMRARSYCLIALIACIVLACDLLWRAAIHLVAHRLLRTAIDDAAALLLALLAWRLWTHGRQFHQDATSPLPSNLPEPDFSALSDGSQRIDALEKMTR